MTIIDVARAAGVSRSTVSLVLNNSPLVKQETREHVLRIIRELGYVPDNNARGLSRKTTNSLGVIIMAEENPQDGYGFDSILVCVPTTSVSALWTACWTQIMELSQSIFVRLQIHMSCQNLFETAA